MPNIFYASVNSDLQKRINLLSEESVAEWGKMNVTQMLAHLNVMFELAMEQKHKRPKAFVRFMLQNLVKKKLINETPYKKNSRTAPEMLIKHPVNFAEQKKRLLHYMETLTQRGEGFFHDKEHPFFGKMSTSEWSTLFYKHIDHHLQQFKV